LFIREAPDNEAASLACFPHGAFLIATKNMRLRYCISYSPMSSRELDPVFFVFAVRIRSCQVW
jgi:hypothetical protein